MYLGLKFKVQNSLVHKIYLMFENKEFYYISELSSDYLESIFQKILFFDLIKGIRLEERKLIDVRSEFINKSKTEFYID